MISESTIQQVKQIPPIDIVSQYVKLKRVGSEWVGLCPFHDERTPSFYISNKGFKCFGCDAGGANVIDFIIKLEKLSFADAVIKVASLAGLHIDGGQVQAAQPKKNVACCPPLREKQPATFETIPPEAIRANLKAYRANHLFAFVAGTYGEVLATEMFTRYHSGSCKWFGEATTLFVQQDINGNFRQLKAILYNPATGKRNKNIDPLIIGKNILAKYSGRDYDSITLSQCYFGEHLLKGNSKPAALVESEKSAMIASLFYPQFIWIATGGKSGAKWHSKEVCSVLTGRDIFLFPDADATENWQSHMRELEKHTGCRVTLIDIMDRQAPPEGKQKYDIADLLIDSGNRSYTEIINSNNKTEPPFTPEEIAYSKLVAINPNVEKLVEGLQNIGLVSAKTGKRIRKVSLL